MRWKPVSAKTPREALLLWSGNDCRIGCMVDGGDAGPVFMDVHSDALLPSPTHWMKLPPGPAESRRAGTRAADRENQRGAAHQ